MEAPIVREVGRPTIMTPETISRLEHAFAHGASDRQACLYAGVSPATLYNYQVDNPEFVERKDALKENVTLQAKLNVAVRILEGDINQSNWWLERKAKDEFSTRTESFNANVDMGNLLSDEEKERIKQLLNADTQP